MSTRTWIAAAALLAAAGCQLVHPQNGDAYAVQGDPWAAKPAEPKAGSGGGGGQAAAPQGEAPATAAATNPAAATAASNAKEGRAPAPATPISAMTVLEQLEEARARIRTLDAENTQLKNDVAALTTLADQLKQQNQNLAQLSDANVQSRAALDQEMDKVRTEQKSLEARCRTLADDLLGERIQRVRVERELILAKVKQAEGKEDGP